MPAIARWPGKIPANVVSDQPCITFDFTASIARAARVEVEPSKQLEGIDIIAHVAQQKVDVERTLFWRKPRGVTVWKGVRDGNLKYVAERKGERQKEFLFDLATDIQEQKDLKGERPEEFQRLQKMYQTWETKVRRDRRGKP